MLIYLDLNRKEDFALPTEKLQGIAVNQITREMSALFFPLRFESPKHSSFETMSEEPFMNIFKWQNIFTLH